MVATSRHTARSSCSRATVRRRSSPVRRHWARRTAISVTAWPPRRRNTMESAEAWDAMLATYTKQRLSFHAMVEGCWPRSASVPTTAPGKQSASLMVVSGERGSSTGDDRIRRSTLRRGLSSRSRTAPTPRVHVHKAPDRREHDR